MRLKRQDLKKVQRELSFAYKSGEEKKVGDAWEERLMIRIRGLGPLTSRGGFTVLFERYVWRFSPIAGLILLVLAGVLYHQMGFLSECEMARVFVENRCDDSLFQVLDVL